MLIMANTAVTVGPIADEFQSTSLLVIHLGHVLARAGGEHGLDASISHLIKAPQVPDECRAQVPYAP